MLDPNYLGRLVAAERNALAAIELGKQLSSENAVLKERLARVDALTSQLEQRLSQIQVRQFSQIGSGPTS